MMVVCKDWLERLRAEQARKNDVNAIVENDVSSIMQGKSYEQLSQLQRQIQAKLGSGEPIDVDYWEGLLKNVIVWKAKVPMNFVLYIRGANVFVGKAYNLPRSCRSQSFRTASKTATRRGIASTARTTCRRLEAYT